MACFWHDYKGSGPCPACMLEKSKEMEKQAAQDREEHLEDLRSFFSDIKSDRYAMEAAAAQMEEAAERQERAAEDYRRTEAEGWKLRSDSIADKAYELYKAGLHEDAIRLSLQGISHNRGNIRAYRFAAWSYEKLGQVKEAKELLKKQISLLKTAEYKYGNRRNRDHALFVLKDILDMDDNEDLIRDFSITSMGFDYFPGALLDELMRRSLYEIAINLYSDTSSTDILGSAYGIELSNRSSRGSVGSLVLGYLKKYLKEKPFTERFNILAAFREARESKKFSEKTLNAIRKEIINRYEEWKPDIMSEFVKLAEEKAKLETDNKSSPTVVGWAIGITSFYIWYKFLQFLVLSSIIYDPGTFMSWVLCLAPPITVGVAGSKSLRSILFGKKKNAHIKLLAEEEKAKLDESFYKKALPSSGSTRYNGYNLSRSASRVIIPELILIVICIVIIIGIVSIRMITFGSNNYSQSKEAESRVAIKGKESRTRPYGDNSVSRPDARDGKDAKPIEQQYKEDMLDQESNIKPSEETASLSNNKLEPTAQMVTQDEYQLAYKTAIQDEERRINSLPFLKRQKVYLLHKKGVKAMRNENWEDAIQYFAELLRSDPDNYEANVNLGGAYAEIRRSSEALEYLQRASRLIPSAPQPYINTFYTYAYMGDIESAIGALQKAVDRGTEHIEHIRRDTSLPVDIRQDTQFTRLIGGEDQGNREEETISGIRK